MRHKRHAYATHPLENGLPVHRLQRLLGHGNLQSTMRYVHWVPDQRATGQGVSDLIAGLGVTEAATLQQVLHRFLRTDGLDGQRRRICGHLQACRTEAMGGMRLRCGACGDEEV